MSTVVLIVVVVAAMKVYANIALAVNFWLLEDKTHGFKKVLYWCVIIPIFWPSWLLEKVINYVEKSKQASKAGSS